MVILILLKMINNNNNNNNNKIINNNNNNTDYDKLQSNTVNEINEKIYTNCIPFESSLRQ